MTIKQPANHDESGTLVPPEIAGAVWERLQSKKPLAAKFPPAGLHIILRPSVQTPPAETEH